MNEWTQCLSSKIGADKLKKLTSHHWKCTLMGQSSCDSKIFGKCICDDGEAVNNSLYVYVLVSWLEIASSVLFNPLTRDEVKTLIDKMLKFEPILTATIFNRIF